jgi:molybdopterin-guanine dinucleotide biosynthesis protein A
VWRDERDERASIVGIHTALVHAETVLVVAWDMPFVTDALVRAIAGRLTPEVGAVVPIGPRGPEPMCALYTRHCLDVLRRALDAGDLRLTSLVEHLPRVASLSLREIEKLGDPERLFFNVNTPDDLRAAEDLASR